VAKPFCHNQELGQGCRVGSCKGCQDRGVGISHPTQANGERHEPQDEQRPSNIGWAQRVYRPSVGPCGTVKNVAKRDHGQRKRCDEKRLHVVLFYPVAQ
jgi:hypothetical protein